MAQLLLQIAQLPCLKTQGSESLRVIKGKTACGRVQSVLGAGRKEFDSGGSRGTWARTVLTPTLNFERAALGVRAISSCCDEPARLLHRGSLNQI